MGRKNSRKPVARDPCKLQKVDNSWTRKLGQKRSKIVRKLAGRINSLASEEVEIPFNIPITSIDIIYRGSEKTWFHDNKAEDCKVMVRLDGLDDEGLGMHLSETAKIVQWVLWNPLIGDPNTSRQAPDRVWRESEYSTPADFLLSYVNTNKAPILADLVADRWDAAMILGGSEQVKTLIKKHIRSDNHHLKDSITQWMGRLKWHQDWDWEDICEQTIFGNGTPRFDIFWEDESYEVPDSFHATEVWSKENPYIAHNLRYIVTEVPGFEDVKKALCEEERTLSEWELDQSGSQLDASRGSSARNSAGNSASNSAGSSMCRSMGLDCFDFATPERPALKPITRATSGRRAGFRPDRPYNGANKLAFDKHFEKHGILLSSKKIKAPLPAFKPPSSGRQKRQSEHVDVVKKKKFEKRVEKRVSKRVSKKKKKTTRRRNRRRSSRRRSRSRSRSCRKMRRKKPRYVSTKRKAKKATKKRRNKKRK